MAQGGHSEDYRPYELEVEAIKRMIAPGDRR